MALLVEDGYFSQKSIKNNKSLSQPPAETFINELAHSIIPNNSFYIRQKTQKNIVALKTLRVCEKQYQIRLSYSHIQSTLKIDLYQFQQSSYRQIRSKNKRISMIKQLTKHHKQAINEGIFYLQGGRLVFTIIFSVQDLYSLNKKHTLHKIILNNLPKFKMLYSKLNQTPSDCLSDYEKEIQIVQVVNTTTGYFDIFNETSQYLMALENQKKQKQSVLRITEYIVDQPILEKNITFYCIRKKSCISRRLKQNLVRCEEELQKKGKKLLLSSFKPDNKMLQDFIYNLVKVQIIQKSKNPIGEGGSSYIFLSRVLLTYINSMDSTIIQSSKTRIQKLVAMKSIKPGLEQMMKGKLKHQINIASKMKGSCCNFIPRYYGTQEKSQFNNEIIMQYIYGEQLDKYIEKRSETISLSTKIVLLSNIYHGFRHLVSYKITHLDLKPINIMVIRHLHIKIIDYGEAYNKEICKENYCPGYTFPYAAPEVYSRYEDNNEGRNQKYLYFSEKQDVYAFGLIMFQLFFSRQVFEMSSRTFKKVYYERSMYERVMSSVEMSEDYGDSFTMSILLRMIVQCLHPDPQKRPFFDWIGLSLKLILYSHICQ